MSEIDEIFDDNPQEETVEEVTEEAKAEPEQEAEETAEVEGDKPEATEDEPVAEEPAPPADEESQWTKTMAIDERRKRQAAEERLRDLEARLSQQEAAPAKERPDVFEDAEGAFKHTEETFEQRIVNERVNMSRSMMEMMHDDYSDMEQAFIALAKDNPALANQMYASANPAKFAYDTAKQHSEIQKFSDPNYAENLKAQIRAEVLAELKEDAKPTEAEIRNQTAANVTNLSTTTAKGGNTVNVEQLDDLDDMFGDSVF